MIEPILVLGASGGVGIALLRQLAQRDARVIAWSRHGKGVGQFLPRGVVVQLANSARDESDPFAESWQAGDLFVDPLPAASIILSAGPIDGLVSALSRSPHCTPRVVVALSSSSAQFKRDSIAPEEREVAARLLSGERSLQDLTQSRSGRLVVLRPTLIYGGHNSVQFDGIEATARTFGLVALPRSARGLRMPIHVDDLAVTMLRSCESNAAQGVFDVGGGETLPYHAMVKRLLEARGLKPRAPRVPDFLFRALLHVANYGGRLQGLTHAMVLRMREDLVVDDTAARRDLGHDPGPFRPGHSPWSS